VTVHVAQAAAGGHMNPTAMGGQAVQVQVPMGAGPGTVLLVPINGQNVRPPPHPTPPHIHTHRPLAAARILSVRCALTTRSGQSIGWLDGWLPCRCRRSIRCR
jgi:hypothetical protein